MFQHFCGILVSINPKELQRDPGAVRRRLTEARLCSLLDANKDCKDIARVEQETASQSKATAPPRHA